MFFKKLVRNPFFWAFILSIFALHIIKELAMARRSAPTPMVFVSDWQLTDQNNKPFGKKDLGGKVVVADFFFTSCPTICPKLTQAMGEIHSRFLDKTDQVAFVSFTVDPETDTPEHLKAFMAKNGMDKNNWWSLTGTKQQIHDVAVNKMKLHVGEKEPVAGAAEGVYDVPHLGELVLLDQNGDLRGLFKTDSTEMSALVRAVLFLLEKGP
jgi:protein SCO1/2